MVSSPLARRLAEPVKVYHFTPITDEDTQATTPAWTEGEIYAAIVTTPVSQESIEVGADLMNRRKVVRLFQEVQLSGLDELDIRGERWTIDGIPTISRGYSGRVITTVYANKTGE